MSGWTIKELEDISDLAFINTILQERINRLTNPYSPLSTKLHHIQGKLKPKTRFDENGQLQDVE